MAVVHYHPRAQADLDELWDYIAQDNPDAADRYLEELHHRAETYAARPAMGRPEQGVGALLNLPDDVELRSFLHRNHRGYYLPIPSGIVVLRTLDTRRDRDAAFEEE